MEQAANFRQRKNPGGLHHDAMRAHLDAVAEASEENPYELHREVPPTLPWREYIAFHAKCDLFVGPGIEHFYLYSMPEAFLASTEYSSLLDGTLREHS